MTATNDHALMRREIRNTLKGFVAHATGKDDRGPDRKVHRNSYDVGDSRARVFRPVGDGSVPAGLNWIEDQKELARQIRLYNLKDPRRPQLLPSHLLLHEALLGSRDFPTGKWDPDYTALIKKTGLSRDTIATGLDALETVGLIGRVRRTVKIDSEGQSGPQRKQISNAYFFDPMRLVRIARQWWTDRCEARRRKAALRAVIAANATERANVATPIYTPALKPESQLQKALVSFERSLLAREVGTLSPSPST